MSPRQKNALIYSSYASILTGLLYGVFKYFMKVQGLYGLQSHPFQAHFHHLHIILSPLLIFCIGVIWQDHIWFRIVCGYQKLRRSGLIMTALFILMTFSGYLLQSSVESWTTNLWKWSHIGSSILWTILFIYHQFIGQKLKRPVVKR